MILPLTVLLLFLFSVNCHAPSNKTIGAASSGRNTFKCYVCFWSLNDEPCGDANFTVRQSQSGKYMINCLACYKQTYFAAEGVRMKVLRGCAQESSHYALRCQYIYNDDNSYMETCACASQYCNGAFQSGISSRVCWPSTLAVAWWIIMLMKVTHTSFL